MLLMNLTYRCLTPTVTSAARWQACAGSTGVVYCLGSLPLTTFTVGGNLQGQLESIEGSAIKDRRHMQI